MPPNGGLPQRRTWDCFIENENPELMGALVRIAAMARVIDEAVSR